MLSFFIVIILWIASLRFGVSTSHIDCVSLQSGRSGNDDDDQTRIGCPSSHPIMTSCGLFSYHDSEHAIDGTITDPIADRCTAQNGNGGQGIYAVSRCCKFPTEDVTCSSYHSNYVLGIDGTISISCNQSSNEYLTGCSAYSPYIAIDGSYPTQKDPINYLITPNIDYKIDGNCTAHNGAPGGGTRADAVCCKSPSYALKCVVRYGVKQNISYQSSSVNCSFGYTMLGCSGLSDVENINAWYIDQNNVCKARTYKNNIIYAVAICCKMETDSPTMEPTYYPTVEPTIEPTKYPTPAPTKNPTIDPTADPTMNPTRDPTIEPTINPTIDPTTDPTTQPTGGPTQDPTQAPTRAPTTVPTIYPTIEPTRGPTRDPTAEPTRNPTKMPSSIPSTTLAQPKVIYEEIPIHNEPVFWIIIAIILFISVVVCISIPLCRRGRRRGRRKTTDDPKEAEHEIELEIISPNIDTKREPIPNNRAEGDLQNTEATELLNDSSASIDDNNAMPIELNSTDYGVVQILDNMILQDNDEAAQPRCDSLGESDINNNVNDADNDGGQKRIDPQRHLEIAIIQQHVADQEQLMLPYTIEPLQDVIREQVEWESCGPGTGGNSQEQKDAEEKKSVDEAAFTLNANAQPYTPKNGGIQKTSNHSLQPIEEPEFMITEECVSLNPTKSCRGKGNIFIPYILTESVIPLMVIELLPYIYEFMDQAVALLSVDIGEIKTHCDIGERRILSYNFHDNKTNEVLYCVIERQDEKTNRNYKWKMSDKLYTVSDIKNKYPEFRLKELPISPYANDTFTHSLNHIYNIQDILQSECLQSIIETTQWHKLHIFCKQNKNEKTCLYLTKEAFIKRLEIEMIVQTKKENKMKLIPIILFNQNNDVIHAFIQIITINGNDNIGISYEYIEEINRIQVIGIHLNKEQILQQHQLIVPQHMIQCHCLDNFTSNITALKIGNLNEAENQRRALQQRYNGVVQRNRDLAQKNQVLVNENRRLRSNYTMMRRKVSDLEEENANLKEQNGRLRAQSMSIPSYSISSYTQTNTPISPQSISPHFSPHFSPHSVNNQQLTMNHVNSNQMSGHQLQRRYSVPMYLHPPESR